MFLKNFREKYPSASVYLQYLFFLYKNGNFLKKRKYKIWLKYTLKRTKLYRFKNFLGGCMPPNPASRAACRFATCKFLNLKTNLGPSPPKSWERPETVYYNLENLYKLLNFRTTGENTTINDHFWHFINDNLIYVCVIISNNYIHPRNRPVYNSIYFL